MPEYSVQGRGWKSPAAHLNWLIVGPPTVDSASFYQRKVFGSSSTHELPKYSLPRRLLVPAPLALNYQMLRRLASLFSVIYAQDVFQRTVCWLQFEFLLSPSNAGWMDLGGHHTPPGSRT